MIWVVLLVAGVALRLAANNLRSFSPADETMYLRHATSRTPLRAAVVVMPFNAPPPYRLGWIWLCRVLRARSYRDLALISTAFSVASLAVVALALPGARERAFALALVGTSPILLAMGRRALQDAGVACVATLYVIAAWQGSLWPALAAGFLLASFKEVTLAAAAPAALLAWRLGVGTWAGAVLVALAPGAAYGALLAILVGDVRLLIRKMASTVDQSRCDYAVAFGRGPVQTYAVQWLMMSPLAALLTVAEWRWDALHVAALAQVAVLSLSKFKNMRFFTPADLLLRVALATSLAAAPYGWWLLALSSAADLAVFWRVFLRDEVYDPVFFNCAASLRMVPSPN